MEELKTITPYAHGQETLTIGKEYWVVTGCTVWLIIPIQTPFTPNRNGATSHDPTMVGIVFRISLPGRATAPIGRHHM